MALARTVSDLFEAVASLAEGQLPAQLLGDAAVRIERVASLETAQPADLAFFANPRYRQQALQTAAGALVLAGAASREIFPKGRAPGALIVCEAPYAWFAYAAQALAPPEPVVAGRAASAVIASGARVDPSARVDDCAVIGEAAVVEAGA